jgi:hypothetical protein
VRVRFDDSEVLKTTITTDGNPSPSTKKNLDTTIPTITTKVLTDKHVFESKPERLSVSSLSLGDDMLNNNNNHHNRASKQITLLLFIPG